MTQKVPLVYYKEDGTRIEIGNCEVNVDGTRTDIWGTIDDPKIKELLLKDVTFSIGPDNITAVTHLVDESGDFVGTVASSDFEAHIPPEISEAVAKATTIKLHTEEPRSEDAISSDIPRGVTGSPGGADVLPGVRQEVRQRDEPG